MDSRKTYAIAFINEIRNMEAEDLNALITRVAGEDLAGFFLDYSAQVISAEPERVLENTSSLMLLGYLLAKAEKSQTAGQTYDLGAFGKASVN